MNSPLGNQPTRSHAGIRTIEVNGLGVQVHSPRATVSRIDGSVEKAANLAPLAPIEVYPVDLYPGCPDRWLRSDRDNHVGSYFMMAKPDHMVWFDLNMNTTDPHQVAAIFSAQGVCALTGQEMKIAQLAQYRENCPVHDRPFRDQHFCSECGYGWAPQNYLASTATRTGAFWRDGFVGEDGKTREFVFTQDEREGVAANIIGESRINAFGLALFRSREPKPPPRHDVYRSGSRNIGSTPIGSVGGMDIDNSDDEGGFESFGLATRGATLGYKSLEVKAGAMVRQEVETDHMPLEYWHERPDAQILIYYVDERQFQEILTTGPVRQKSFLAGHGIPTGHRG